MNKNFVYLLYQLAWLVLSYGHFCVIVTAKVSTAGSNLGKSMQVLAVQFLIAFQGKVMPNTFP